MKHLRLLDLENSTEHIVETFMKFPNDIFFSFIGAHHTSSATNINKLANTLGITLDIRDFRGQTPDKADQLLIDVTKELVEQGNHDCISLHTKDKGLLNQFLCLGTDSIKTLPGSCINTFNISPEQRDTLKQIKNRLTKRYLRRLALHGRN